MFYLLNLTDFVYDFVYDIVYFVYIYPYSNFDARTIFQTETGATKDSKTAVWSFCISHKIYPLITNAIC